MDMDGQDSAELEEGIQSLNQLCWIRETSSGRQGPGTDTPVLVHVLKGNNRPLR